jgi:hypothetical protein
MATKQQIAAQLTKNYFSAITVYETGGFVPFIAATDGLAGQQAATVPAEGINSVWAVVNHLTYLQDGVRQALLKESAEPPSMEGAWAPLGEINDENWLAARQTALDSNRQLAEAIAALTDEQLPHALPGWFNGITEQVIFGINSHISYHTAEIVTIRHMQGLRVDHMFA